MSGNRRDPHKARLRRDRIRREKHNPSGRGVSSESPPPFPMHPFAGERSLRELEALLEGQVFESTDEANAKLSALTEGGRLSERAESWKQDDPKWRAQSLAYDALETESLEEALRLINEALKLDPGCTDAQRLMVSLVPAPLENKVHLMREVVSTAERTMGPQMIAETTGHFWGTVSTRPYMRAKQHLGELLAESGNLGEAIEVFQRMLELNPGDNQGIRYELLNLYLATDQPEAADQLISSFEGEEKILAIFAWGRVLQRWLSGDLKEAAVALVNARKVNAGVEKYIAGRLPTPAVVPEAYRPGDESEAQVCAAELKLGWSTHAEFQTWLRAQTA